MNMTAIGVFTAGALVSSSLLRDFLSYNISLDGYHSMAGYRGGYLGYLGNVTKAWAKQPRFPAPVEDQLFGVGSAPSSQCLLKSLRQLVKNLLTQMGYGDTLRMPVYRVLRCPIDPLRGQGVVSVFSQLTSSIRVNSVRCLEKNSEVAVRGSDGVFGIVSGDLTYILTDMANTYLIILCSESLYALTDNQSKQKSLLEAFRKAG